MKVAIPAIPLTPLGNNAAWHCCELSDNWHLRDEAIETLINALSEASIFKVAATRTCMSETALLSEARSALQSPALQPPSFNTQRHVQVVVPESWKGWCCCDWDGDGHFDMRPYAKVGLPTLGQAVAFTKLAECAAANGCFLIVLSSTNRRAAGAVLSGGNLILAHDFSAEDAWTEVLRANPPPSRDSTVSWDRFPRPFSTSGKTTASSVTVLDCFQGLQYARDLGWISLYGDQAFELAEWSLLRRKFDASWVIPGEVLAMGNPWETAKNPVFPGLLTSPPVLKTVAIESSVRSALPKDLSSFVLGRQVRVDSISTASDFMGSAGSSPRSSETSTVQCVDTWEIDYGATYICDIDGPNIQGDAPDLKLVGLDEADDTQENPEDERIPRRSHCLNQEQNGGIWEQNECRATSSKSVRLMDKSFYSFFVEEGITSVFRLNYLHECPAQDGCLPGFASVGVDVHDCAFNDGEVPSKKLIKGFLESCRDTRKTGQTRIAVHCMAGLGRTGVLLGAYAVAHHGVPGKAFHGWVRMCRPGSVQTEAQERFLRGLTTPRQSASILKIPSSSSMFNAVRKVASWGSNMSFGSSK